MLNLSVPEIKLLLWHIDMVDRAYSNIAPIGSTLETLKAKLQAELERVDAPGKATLFHESPS